MQFTSTEGMSDDAPIYECESYICIAYIGREENMIETCIHARLNILYKYISLIKALYSRINYTYSFNLQLKCYLTNIIINEKRAS